MIRVAAEDSVKRKKAHVTKCFKQHFTDVYVLSLLFSFFSFVLNTKLTFWLWYFQLSKVPHVTPVNKTVEIV